MEYEHICRNCNKEFEQEYSIKADPPTTCPLCGVEGQVERLISLGPGKGIVRPQGREILDRVKSDTQKMVQHAAKNENYAENLIGPKYNETKLANEKILNNFRRVK